MVPQLLSEPIQKLNEANGHENFPKQAQQKHRLC